MAGYDAAVLGHFAANSGTRRNVIYMTGQDMAVIFGGHIGLVDALLTKIGAPESRGEYLIDLMQQVRAPLKPLLGATDGTARLGRAAVMSFLACSWPGSHACIAALR
jgi:hypothetical protein